MLTLFLHQEKEKLCHGLLHCILDLLLVASQFWKYQKVLTHSHQENMKLCHGLPCCTLHWEALRTWEVPGTKKIKCHCMLHCTMYLLKLCSPLSCLHSMVASIQAGINWNGNMMHHCLLHRTFQSLKMYSPFSCLCSMVGLVPAEINPRLGPNIRPMCNKHALTAWSDRTSPFKAIGRQIT